MQTSGDVNVGGDIVGRDKVTQTTTTVTNVGMAPEAVRRLVITVGVMVFVTALCFFSGGLVVGAAALQALSVDRLIPAWRMPLTFKQNSIE